MAVRETLKSRSFPYRDDAWVIRMYRSDRLMGSSIGTRSRSKGGALTRPRKPRMAPDRVSPSRRNRIETTHNPFAVTGCSMSREKSVWRTQDPGIVIGAPGSRNPPSVKSVSLPESDCPIHIADSGPNGRRRLLQCIEMPQGQCISPVFMDTDDE